MVAMSLSEASPSATRPSAFSDFLYAPASVFSAGIARFDDCARAYSCGARSTRAVVFRYTSRYGLRSTVGEVAANWTAPQTAS